MALYGTLGENDIAELSASISDTAVDVFVYDTRKDSDGGAWRHRTQNTSWYNETLNTSIRGSRREFPAVAVIVLTGDTLTIYDGDDPDLPMWMVFPSNGYLSWASSSTPSLSSVYMLNGILVVGAFDGRSDIISCFIKDDTRYYYGAPYYNPTDRTIRGRGVAVSGSSAYLTGGDGYVIVSDQVNDIAMTVLPNAPIDSATGLPVPTIAIATNGGISVIKDDGTVVDLTNGSGSSYNYTYDIAFTKDYKIRHTMESTTKRYYRTHNIPSSDSTVDQWSPDTDDGITFYINVSHGDFAMIGGSNPITTIEANSFGNNSGLTLFDENVASPTNSIVAYASTSYNTGWMHGDIKGAFLSDTTVESLTANTNLATNATQWATGRLTSETYDAGDTSWQMVDNAGNDNGYLNLRLNGLTIGQSYIISMTWDNNAALDSGFNHRIDHNDGSQTNFTHWNKTNASSETLTGVFTAKSQNGEELVFYANAITLNVSNFIVRAVDDEDRSVNNKGLQVFGTVTKSAVASGADLVAYSGGGTSNYLEQPYNSDLAFGANSEFSVTGWMYNTNVGGGQVIIDRSITHNSSRDWQIWVAADLKYMTMYIAGGQATVTPNGSFPNNTWFHFAVVRVGDRAKIYINGVEKANNSSTLSTIPASNVPMKVLYNCNSNTKLALLRISASAPSAEQVKKMYEDEKLLFQENAKATLYGSYDAVTALAYDDDTDLLHVGTSSGRSDFQGLRRINNTTTAVSTAISASNSLIVEQ